MRYSVLTTMRDAPFVVVDANGCEISTVTDYLTELVASDFSRLTVRSYAYELAAWLSFLDARGASWDGATQVDVRDHVLWMRQAPRPNKKSAVDRISRAAGYAACTINHRLTVISSFYDHQLRCGRGPASNPVPQRGRSRSHVSPMEPWIAGPRTAYRQRVPRRMPRAVDDGVFTEMFTTLGSERDRALVAMLVSTGARASELLGMRGDDLDWGGQRARLVGKGDRAAHWVAASPEAFSWLARYLTQREPLAATGAVWLTLRRPFRPLTYPALRAMLLRVNEKLGTHVVLHDFRHTCALRLASDPQVRLIDVQTHLRHQHLSSTQVYLTAPPEEVITQVRSHHYRRTAEPTTPTRPVHGWSYDDMDVTTLLGPNS